MGFIIKWVCALRLRRTFWYRAKRCDSRFQLNKLIGWELLSAVRALQTITELEIEWSKLK